MEQDQSNLSQGHPYADALFMKTLLLAEITRLKYRGKGGFTLTHPTIERNARHRYAAMAGINERSKPEVFIASIKWQYYSQGVGEQFEHTMTTFKLDTNLFNKFMEQ